MASPEAPLAASGTVRLPPAALLAHLASARDPKSHRALLVVALNRSDRLAALAQSAHARLVLAEALRRVEAMLRPGDRYAVPTHDELWIALANLPTPSLAEMAARTLRESLSRPIAPAGSARDAVGDPIVQLRPCVGGASCPGASADEPMALLQCAAEACARAAGDDEHVLVEALDEHHASRGRARIEAELRTALHNNELDVFFQPQVELASGLCVGAEALVRWVRDDGTRVDPAVIAAVCEERGLMGQLTQFVLNTALRHVMTWSSQGIHARVSVNLSSVTLSDASYPALVAQALSTWGVPASRLTLELTEGVIVRNETVAMRFMREVREQGCRLALDDFGTGYSSFAYLQKFPLDEMKIDQSFVRNATGERCDRRILRALVELAHTFEMTALAEGVENGESVALLREIGCEVAQGFHYGAAMPPLEFARWYQRFNAPAPAEATTAGR